MIDPRPFAPIFVSGMRSSALPAWHRNWGSRSFQWICLWQSSLPCQALLDHPNSSDFQYVNKVINQTHQGSAVQKSACSGWCTRLPRPLPAGFLFPGLVALGVLAVKSWDSGGFCPIVLLLFVSHVFPYLWKVPWLSESPHQMGNSLGGEEFVAMITFSTLLPGPSQPECRLV